MTAAQELAADVLAVLEEHGQTVAAAESLTGGLVVAELTAVPGASAMVRGSVTAYATEVKRDVLGGGRAAARRARGRGPRGGRADGPGGPGAAGR
ncbi:hypothetical protein GCM10020000_21320 [Streptomyces olivoverticillatus]